MEQEKSNARTVEYSSELMEAYALVELADQVLKQHYETPLHGKAFMGLSLLMEEVKRLITLVDKDISTLTSKPNIGIASVTETSSLKTNGATNG